MASLETGEMYTQAEFEAMTPFAREKLDLVKLTPTESATLKPMSNEERKVYLKAHKTKSKRVVNKRKRQNRKKARAAR